MQKNRALLRKNGYSLEEREGVARKKNVTDSSEGMEATVWCIAGKGVGKLDEEKKTFKKRAMLVKIENSRSRMFCFPNFILTDTFTCQGSKKEK